MTTAASFPDNWQNCTRRLKTFSHTIFYAGFLREAAFNKSHDVAWGLKD